MRQSSWQASFLNQKNLFDPPYNLRDSNDSQERFNSPIVYYAQLFCKPRFYNNCRLRLPRISALTTPIHSLITPNETGKETVAAGCGGDGSGATAGTAEGFVLCK